VTLRIKSKQVDATAVAERKSSTDYVYESPNLSPSGMGEKINEILVFTR